MADNAGDYQEIYPFNIPAKCPRYTREFGSFLLTRVSADEMDGVSVMNTMWLRYTDGTSEHWRAYHFAGKKRKPRERREKMPTGPMLDMDGNRSWNDANEPNDMMADEREGQIRPRPITTMPDDPHDQCTNANEEEMDGVVGDNNNGQALQKTQLSTETRRAMSQRLKKLDDIVRKYRDPELTNTVREIHALLAI